MVQATPAVCHDRRVTARATLVWLLSLAFLVPQSFGLHWHGGAGHHAHGSAGLVHEQSPSHLQSHLVEGELDVQQETLTPGKVPAVKLYLALFALAFLVLALLPGPRVAWPPLRPPQSRLGVRFLPPSHAPPHVA
jgi:hypothetical protein